MSLKFKKQIAIVLTITILICLTGLAEDGNLVEEDSIIDLFENPDIPVDIAPEGISIGGDLSLSIDDAVNQEFEETVIPTQSVVPSNASTGTIVLGVKETYKITVNNATYKSSKSSVATVSKKGIVTAKKKGTATITVKSRRKTIAIITVKVVAAPKKITLSKKKIDLIEGENYTLVAKLSKNSASKITWSSSNAAVAKINQYGVVTAVSPGNAKITAKTYNKRSAVCKVTVSSRSTPTPTPRVTPDPDDDVIDEDSPASVIRTMQKKLITLGLLPSDGATGIYDHATREAVKRFQRRVNELVGYGVLEVTGIMDELSQAFLDYYYEEWERLRDKPTPSTTPIPSPTPTPSPTPAIDGIINADSSKEDILMAQRLLIEIEMLPIGSDNGIYGSSTVIAVADFQRWVNKQRNEQTLKVTGEVDQLTLLYLQYCRDHGMRPYG